MLVQNVLEWQYTIVLQISNENVSVNRYDDNNHITSAILVVFIGSISNITQQYKSKEQPITKRRENH